MRGAIAAIGLLLPCGCLPCKDGPCPTVELGALVGQGRVEWTLGGVDGGGPIGLTCNVTVRQRLFAYEDDTPRLDEPLQIVCMDGLLGFGLTVGLPDARTWDAIVPIDQTVTVVFLRQTDPGDAAGCVGDGPAVGSIELTAAQGGALPYPELVEPGFARVADLDFTVQVPIAETDSRVGSTPCQQDVEIHVQATMRFDAQRYIVDPDAPCECAG